LLHILFVVVLISCYLLLIYIAKATNRTAYRTMVSLRSGLVEMIPIFVPTIASSAKM